MRTPIKSKNVRRLASISALGAGVALAVGPAEAEVIPVIENQKIGFDSGFGSGPFTFPLIGSASFSIARTSSFFKSHGKQFSSRAVFLNGNAGVEFAISPNSGAFSQGQAWPGGSRSSHLVIATRRNHSRAFGGGSGTSFNDNEQYFLFQFPDGHATLYGWGQLAVVANEKTGPDVTLVEYAYDTTGAFLPAGDTTAPSVPEPSEVLPLALSALVLGAQGVRRWLARRPS
jgi:hypothetical protein